MRGASKGRRIALASIATAIGLTALAAGNASAATVGFANNQLQIIGDPRFTDDIAVTYVATAAVPAMGPGRPGSPERHFAQVVDVVGLDPLPGCTYAAPPYQGLVCEVPLTSYTAKIDLGTGSDRLVANLRYDPAGANGVPPGITYLFDGEGADSASFNYVYPNDATPPEGSVYVYNGPGNDTFSLTPFADRVYSDGVGGGYDKIYGQGGNDSLSGGADGDYIRGGLGNDNIYGGTGNDYLHGDAGNDYENGGAGGDHVYGETGNDRLYGGGHAFFQFDFCYGGLGIDTINGASRDFGIC